MCGNLLHICVFDHIYDIYATRICALDHIYVRKTRTYMCVRPHIYVIIKHIYVHLITYMCFKSTHICHLMHIYGNGS